MEERSSWKMFTNSIQISNFLIKSTLCHTYQVFSIRNAKTWGKHKHIIFRGYFRRGKTTDNFLKLFVKIDFLNDDGQEEELKSKEEIEKEKRDKKKGKNKKIEKEDKEDMVTKLMKKMDIFNKNYIEFMTYLYFNKKQKRNLKKEDLPIPMHGLKVRVYILRCLNLTAQDDSSSLLVKAAGMSAFSKANSFLEIIVGDENAV